MTRGLLGLSTAVVFGMFSAVSAGELKSGLEVGERPPAYNVRDITGPSAGKSLCYRCQYGSKPVVNIFAREMTPALASLVKKVDEQIAKNGDKDLSGFVVVLTEDADGAGEKLTALAKDKSIKKTPLTVFEGEAGPPNYKIAKDADVTVMMWVGSEVKVNKAFAAGKLDDKAVEEIVAKIPTILED